MNFKPGGGWGWGGDVRGVRGREGKARVVSDGRGGEESRFKEKRE